MEVVKKSQEVIEREQRAFHDLVKFIRWFAANNELPGHWLMSKEDLEAEMFFALVRIIPRYMNKSYKEFLVIARTCLTNAVGSLKYKATVTGRKQELTAWSFDHELASYEESEGNTTNENTTYRLTNNSGEYKVRHYFSDDFGYRGLKPETYVQQAEQMDEFYNKLSEFDKQVLDALLGGNERVVLYIDLQRKRKGFVYANPTITITPYCIARALCESEDKVKDSYKRIKKLFLEEN